METILVKKVKARKIHNCDWCAGKINIGEVYEYSTIANEGDIYSWKGHLRCREIAEKLKMFDENNEEGLSEPEFKSYIIEKYIELKEDEKLTYKEVDKINFEDVLNYVCKEILK